VNQLSSRPVLRLLAVLSALLLTLVVAACRLQERKSPAVNADDTAKPLDGAPTREPKREPITRDLEAIRETKTLNVVFTFNSTGYFIYRGLTMGYEYELLERFATDQGLKLKVVLVRDSKVLFDQLNDGKGDVIAAQLVRPKKDVDVLYTSELYETSPVVVQRKGDDPTKGQPPAVATAKEREEAETGPTPIKIRARLVSRPSELAGERVHVTRTSPYRDRLIELNNELDQDIDVIEVDDSIDKLIQDLSEGAIGYTVAAENVAQLKTAEYSNLMILPLLGPPQEVVWAVRRTSPRLLDALNDFIEKERKAGVLGVLYRKYFLDRRASRSRARSGFLTSETGKLSPHDDWFREYSKIPGWDWRLVASQVYQESRFNPSARSWAGATGLMQLMPATARELKVNPGDARRNVEGGCHYLWKLDRYWSSKVPKESERRKFILASYNVGSGHVEDARRLAEKNGDNQNDWDDVAYWLIRKSKRAVYDDPVVKYGFARGVEPVAYVANILERYNNYKEFVAPMPEEPRQPVIGSRF